MKLYIPEIGDQIVLTNDWTFNLYYEYRNSSLMEKIGEKFNWSDLSMKAKAVTIVKGTTLKVDRIYIRKGNSEYSSLTFYIVSGDWKGARFWAKLKDVNNIEFDEVKTTASTISVKIYPSITTAIKDIIIQDRSSYYYQHLYYPPKYIECIVNGVKDIVKITPIVDKRNLTPEEVKTLNAANKRPFSKIVFYGPGRKYSEKDVKIIKYELEATLVSTGKVIAKASTTTTLNKKIKEFLTANPNLVPSK